MGSRMKFTMTNGDVWEAEQSSGGLSDEISFEREFKVSSAVLAITAGKAQAHLAAVEEAVKAGEEPPEPDPGIFPRSEHMAFFGWRQLRREHPGLLPARFSAFVDEVESMDYVADPEAAEASGTDEQGDGGEVDPLVAEVVAINGAGCLDPTVRDQRPMSRPSSSSTMASATPISK